MARKQYTEWKESYILIRSYCPVEPCSVFFQKNESLNSFMNLGHIFIGYS